MCNKYRWSSYVCLWEEQRILIQKVEREGTAGIPSFDVFVIVCKKRWRLRSM